VVLLNCHVVYGLGEKIVFLKSHISQPGNVEFLLQLKKMDGSLHSYESEIVRNLRVFESTDLNEKGRLLTRDEGASTKVAYPQNSAFVVILVLDVSRSVDYMALSKQVFNFVKSSFEANPNIKFVINYFDGRDKLLHESKDDKFCIYDASQLDDVKECLDVIKEQRLDPSTNLYGVMTDLADNVYPQIKKQVIDDSVENTVKTFSIIVFTDGKDRTFRATQNEAYRAIDRLSNEKDLTLYSLGLKTPQLDYGFIRQFGNSYQSKDYKGLKRGLANILEEVDALADSYFVMRVCTPKRSSPLRYEFNHTILDNAFLKFINENKYTYGCDCENDSQWTY